MRFIDTDQLTRTFSRPYLEESAVALSAIDCVLNGEKAVYASTELTTGRRVQAALREFGGSKSSDLRRHLGEQAYADRIWNPNVEAAMAFARRLHHSLGGNQLVVTPAPFACPGWNQTEYLGFWETLIRTRIKAVYFNDAWEYSNGCAFEFLVAIDAGLPTFDATAAPIELAAGITRIEEAIVALRTEGIDHQALLDTFQRLQQRAVADGATRRG